LSRGKGKETPESSPGTVRPGGRTERNRRAVARATLDLLRRGDTELKPAVVAEEAGVSIPTIKRRWPTRADLVREALTLHTRSLRVPDTGSFESDVHALARAVARYYSDPTEIALWSVMASNADPDFTKWKIDHYMQHVKGIMGLFEMAVERGEISSDCDYRLLYHMLASPMFVQTAIIRKKPGKRFIEDLAAFVIQAARGASDSGDPVPG